MKTLLRFFTFASFVILLGTIVKVQAQSTPEGVNYQAVVRDGSGNVLTNTTLTVRVGIYDGPSSTGTLLYEETHNVTSSAYGTINFVIGQGTVNAGDFTTIDWLNVDAYAKVDVDPGSGYVNISETKLQSVPYALAAKKSLYADSVINKQWGENTTSLFSTSKNVGIGTAPASGFKLDVYSSFTGDSAAIRAYQYYAAFIGASANGPTIGGVGIQGKNDMFGISTLDIQGSEIGLLGVSNGLSSIDNYGVFGYSNGMAGRFVNSGTNGYTADLATTTHAGDFNGPVRVQGNTTSPQPNTMYGNTMPLAYGVITYGGGISTDYGIASVTKPSTGEYVITLDNSYVGDPVVLVTSFNSSADTELFTYESTNGGNTITVRCVDENNNPIGSMFSILVFGTPQ